MMSPAKTSSLGVFVLLLVCSQCAVPAGPALDPGTASHAYLPRHATPGPKRAGSGRVTHPLAVDTSERLTELRELMKAADLSAYIITSSDDHQSEYIANHDKRREFISGFSGSSGDAVVTLDAAALWTDSRYFLQAEQQLDCNWLLMRSGQPEVPTIQQWLAEELEEGDNISSDPRIASYTEWASWNSSLANSGLKLELHLENLVDKIWLETDGRPPYPSSPVFIHDIKYAGKSWEDKLKDVHVTMAQKNASLLVVTALDEIAWVLNLRGDDVPFTPVFRSYLLVGSDWASLYLPEDKITTEITEHLTSCSNDTLSVSIKPYDHIWSELSEIGCNASWILLPSPRSYAKGASYLIYHLLPPKKIIFIVPPLLIMKDSKNAVEVQGMKNAHIRDAVALSQLLYNLEEGITMGECWDELKVVSSLELLRRKQPLSKGPSFETIAAFGTNAALPHYIATPETNNIINSSGLFMLDSGGQYYDGTTDVTRTVHMGLPSILEKEIYTRLLMGCIDIASVLFPEGQTLNSLEILIRAPLYAMGLNYGHGSTHGIGAFLAVHEAFNTTYHVNFFGSQEPGYYRDNAFGMRLENIVTVVPAHVTPFEGKNFLTFETVTLVPYERKLIDVTLLSPQQIKWLDSYHAKVKRLVGAELLKQGYLKAFQWLLDKTKPMQPMCQEKSVN